ncbi:unnamed protein product, partial [Aphanomyces euteiches]
FKTPTASNDIAVLEDGSHKNANNALGLQYLSPPVVGHYIQYFVIGILLGSLNSMNAPVFSNYFHMTTPQANLIKGFTTIVWSCKAGFGILSDCFPILGYRRKSWMILGWALCLISLLVLAIRDHGPPYVANSMLFSVKNLTAEQQAILASPNLDAPSNGTVVSILCAIVTVFYVMADVAADSMVVEMSHREPEMVRGRLLGLIYGFRNIGSALAQVMIGSLLHSPVYGGDYSWGIKLGNFFFLLAGPVALMIPVVVFMLKETKRHVINCPQYLGEFWHIVQTRSYWQTMLFAFFYSLFTSVVLVTATPTVKYVWANVSYQNNRWITAVSSSVMYSIGIWFMSHIANNWNWRKTIALLTVTQVVLGSIVDFFTIYDVVRSQWFTLVENMIVAIPQGASNLSYCLIFMELAQDGKEGIMYGMLTTMANVAYLFTPFIGTAVMNQFKIDASVVPDSSQHRGLVASPIAIGYVCSLLACFFVYLLPEQKHHIEFMKAYGGKQPLFAAITLFICFGSMIATVIISILSVFPSTMCLSVGGGTDC